MAKNVIFKIFFKDLMGFYVDNLVFINVVDTVHLQFFFVYQKREGVHLFCFYI